MLLNRFTLTSLVGVLVFGITLWLGALSPQTVAHPAEGDARDPIIAFEMVRDTAELTAVIGENRVAYAPLRDAIDKVNRIDFLYMTVYGGFIALFFMAVAQQRSDRRWLILSVVGIVAMLADVRENMVLLQLTQDGADVAPLIETLISSTWIKWFALGLTSLGAGYAMFEDTSMPRLRLIAMIVGLSASIFTCLSYLEPLKFPQYMALAIFLTWLLMVVYAHLVGRAQYSQA